MFSESDSAFEAQFRIVTDKTAKLGLSDQITTADHLIRSIESLVADYAKTIRAPNADAEKITQLKSQWDEVNFYFNQPHLVLKASYHGGLQTIKDQYGSALLKINLHLNSSRILTEEESKKAYRGFGFLIRQYKEKRAYTDIYRGKKNIKAGLGKFDEKKPATQPNPIAIQSKKNIQKLIKELRNGKKGGGYKSCLRADEFELFKALLDLPWRIQHATNHYYPMLNAGALDSYAELKRRSPEYKSPFSTNGNVDKLGNGGFVFFRVYVDPINSQDTRYGNTTLIFNINLLQNAGWISLHDQLKPFPSKNTWRFYWEKRLLRTSEEVNINASTHQKSLYDGLLYSYRASAIASYDKGPLDTQKSFGEKIKTTKTIKTITRKQSFLEEIFFGKDIMLGIALSVIRELRYLETCGFREGFITAFGKANEQKKALLFGKLIKELFRIEGKYPVSLRFEANLTDKNQRFFEYVDAPNYLEDRSFRVVNPDGDGRYNVDGSENTGVADLAFLADRGKGVEDELHIARCQAARIKEEDSPQKKKWIKKTQHLEDEQRQIQKKLADDRAIREKLIQIFVKRFEVAQDLFSKVDTQKLQLLHDKFSFLLDETDVELEDILSISTQVLKIMCEDSYYTLLENGLIDLCELAECTLPQLETLVDFDLSKPFCERNMTLFELIKLHDENPMHLVCLTCDDLTELVLENAPDIDPIVREYAEEEDVDFQWVLEQLCESEQVLFRQNMGWDEQDPEENNDDYDDEYEYEPDERYLEGNEYNDDTGFSDGEYSDDTEQHSDSENRAPDEASDLSEPDDGLTLDFSEAQNKLSKKTTPSILHRFNYLKESFLTSPKDTPSIESTTTDAIEQNLNRYRAKS